MRHVSVDRIRLYRKACAELAACQQCDRWTLPPPASIISCAEGAMTSLFVGGNNNVEFVTRVEAIITYDWRSGAGANSTESCAASHTCEHTYIEPRKGSVPIPKSSGREYARSILAIGRSSSPPPSRKDARACSTDFQRKSCHQNCWSHPQQSSWKKSQPAVTRTTRIWHERARFSWNFPHPSGQLRCPKRWSLVEPRQAVVLVRTRKASGTKTQYLLLLRHAILSRPSMRSPLLLSLVLPPPTDCIHLSKTRIPSPTSGNASHCHSSPFPNVSYSRVTVSTADTQLRRQGDVDGPPIQLRAVVDYQVNYR